jgi:hypothetical protein
VPGKLSGPKWREAAYSRAKRLLIPETKSAGRDAPIMHVLESRGMLRMVVFRWLAVMAALVSAGLWFAAAMVPLQASEFATYGKLTPEAQRLFVRQVRLAGSAAIATGISALFQVMTLLLLPV